MPAECRITDFLFPGLGCEALRQIVCKRATFATWSAPAVRLADRYSKRVEFIEELRLRFSGIVLKCTPGEIH